MHRGWTVAALVHLEVQVRPDELPLLPTCPMTSPAGTI